MFCSNCGCKLEDGVNFCPNCGTSQVKVENSQSVKEIPIVTQQKTGIDEQFQSSVKIGFVQAMKLYFENLFNFKGRATRSEFWWSFLFNIVVVGIALLLCKVFSCDDWDYFTLVPIILASSVSVRRLHDAGFFGFTVIVMLVCLIVVSGFDICGVENTVQDIFGYSFIGSALVLFILACKKSSQKENKWGVNIRIQSERQNAVPVMSKKAWRNVWISIASTVAVFVVCIICQNVFYPSSGAVTSVDDVSEKIAQIEDGQIGNEQTVVQTSGNIRSHWTDNYPAKQWIVEDSGHNCFILKKDTNNRIYLVVLNEDEPYRDVLSLCIFTDKGNSKIVLSKPTGMLLPSDERIDMANKLISIANKNINKSYASFVETMKKDSQKLLLKTAVIKPGYKSVNKTEWTMEYDGHQRDVSGREMRATKWKWVPRNRVVEERDSSQDMHVRPYKIIQVDHSSDKVETTSFNNLPIELFEYQGQL